MDGTINDEDCSGVVVSPFDYCIEKYFKATDTISELCGVKEEEETEASCASELESFSSTVTFLREWKYLCYKPRIVRFHDENGSVQGEDICNGISLPQFSSASTPKLKRYSSETSNFDTRKDFLLYAGGPIWGLDWCPSVDQRSDCHFKCEYLAVAAHPPDSSYHKIGAALIGRGVIQIWCLLNVNVKDEELPPSTNPKGGKGSGKVGAKGSGKGRGRPRKQVPLDDSSPPLKRPKWRPSKKATKEVTFDLDSDTEYVPPLSVYSVEGNKPSPPLRKARARPKKKTYAEESFGDLDSNCQLVQVLDVQLDMETDNALPPLQKARGRSKNKTVIEESYGDLDSTNQLSIQLYKEKDKSVPPLKKASKKLKKKMVMEESCGALDTNSQFVQGEENTNETSQLLDKPKRRQRKTVVTAECHGDMDNGSQSMEALDVLVDKDTNTTLPQLQKVKKKIRKKKIVSEYLDDVNGDNQIVPYVGDELLEDPSGVLAKSPAVTNSHEQNTVEIPYDDVELKRERQEGGCSNAVLTSKPTLTYTRRRKRKLKEITNNRNEDSGPFDPLLSLESRANESPFAALPASSDCGQQIVASSPKEYVNGCSEISTPNLHLPNDVILPRVVLCLAHNGKVAWDVKWRPSDNKSGSKHCMGYLAVLLGNGSLEVWKVPFPRTAKILFSSHKKEGTDPRFMKLAPVFKCSKLKFGDKQSVPLTLEWSRSAPHDMILAGCHDGTVALWRFSPTASSQDTRPLLCFSADNAPIRSLAWAPSGSDEESANVIATAGHGGLKFWDLRDPYRPLWGLNPARRIIYSLDWLSDPGCIIMSSDDGTLRFLSMSKSAVDAPVTGMPFTGTQENLHCYACLSFPIWSVHASKQGGMIAYCSADGSALRFQLTSKAVDKDHSRNKAPHFLCGSLTDEGPTLVINTPLTETPVPLKPLNESRFQSNMNQAKRTSNKTPDDSNLALCYKDDPSNLSSEKTPASRKSNATSTSRAAMKKPSSDQALSISGGTKPKVEKETEIDVFPSKIVAMHRVRWNMNKGSERWLCFGGAAGIVRCQKIPMHFFS